MNNINLKTTFYIVGGLLTGLSMTMLLPVAYEFLVYELFNIRFFYAFVTTFFFGIMLWLSFKPSGEINLGTKDAFITTTAIWLVLPLFSGLPFIGNIPGISILDCFFEGFSSFTTTGATVITDIKKIDKCVILWRSILQWLGGIGIVVMAMTFFPQLRIGGIQLYRSEFSDKTNKILPKISQIASAILSVYAFFTVLCILLLLLTGTKFFDALCFAMSSISTGGLTSSNEITQGIGSVWNEIIIMFFMLIGGSPFILYIRILFNKDWSAFHDSQFKSYVLYILITTAIVTLWYFYSNHTNMFVALRKSSFLVISYVSTTGLALDNYHEWGSFISLMIFILSLSGGCSGSTSGGIKIFRFQILINLTQKYLKQLKNSYQISVPKFQNENISENIAFAVMAFAVIYFFTILVLSVIFSLQGLSFHESITISVCTLGNVGSGLDLSPTNGSLASLNVFTKIVMMFSMILGRLELITILILFMPSFWKEK
ncbi:MAG: hypothetical protein C0432_02520 [Candidatus Puniceispirillum sp.]|nr:hypothetical protein [Candidatus Pelagibacter sp.]MBA4283149.1 hypothetical protein [Candidatus Puniceispirillum sp.]